MTSITPLLDSPDLSAADFAIFQPDYCDTPRNVKPNARPFTASSSNDNIYACVHFAQNLQSICGPLEPSTYVVLRVGRVLDATNSSEIWCSQIGEKRTYTYSFTQFASTKVVDKNSNPNYNEVLVASVPQEAKANGWGIQIDLVLRIANGEDNLLAFIAMPLDLIYAENERSIAFHLPPHSQSSPVLYVSLFRQKRNHSADAKFNRIEFLIGGITKSHPLVQPEETILLIHTSTTPSKPATTVNAPLPFIHVYSPANLIDLESQEYRVTPSGVFAEGQGFVWHYPIIYDFHELPALLYIHISLFTTSVGSAERKCAGSSLYTAIHVESTSGAKVRCPEIMIRMAEAPFELHLNASMRVWSSVNWGDFRKERVACTNRHGKKVPTQPWMGAIARGLNRHPISAVDDTGGINGAIAAMYTSHDTPREEELPVLRQESSKIPLGQSIPQLQATVDDILKGQLHCLTQELASKQVLIDKLQVEVDKRTNAIKSCGNEIIELRKSNQRKDQTIQNLQIKLHNYEEIEQRQQEELRICLEGNGFTAKQFPVLAQHYTKLQAKFNDLESSHSIISRKLLESKNFEAELIELNVRYRKLDEAHQSQAMFIQKANAEMQKIAVYKQTIAAQESVIAKLERLVESKLAEAKNNPNLGPNVHAEIFRLRLENTYLKEQSKLQITSGRLHEMPQPLTVNQTPTMDPISFQKLTTPRVLQPLQLKQTGLDDNKIASRSIQRQQTIHQVAPEKFDRYTMTDETHPQDSHTDESVLGMRIRMLEEQLQLNTTNAAQEIAVLKARLFEYEMGSVW